MFRMLDNLELEVKNVVLEKRFADTVLEFCTTYFIRAFFVVYIPQIKPLKIHEIPRSKPGAV